MISSIFTVATLATAVLAQQSAYGQCGGQGYSGSTSCVSGFTCKFQSQYYSQCLPGGPATTTLRTTTTTRAATPTSTTASGGNGGSGCSGQALKASFTQYGSGDSFGSGNCQVKSTACGFYTTGYNAAISQNYFGVGPGAGAGPACGTCYQLTIQTDSSGKQVANHGNSIVVQVDNLCPSQGNPICSQSSKTSTNQYGAVVNFDLCLDSKANTALFQNDNIGLGVGTAIQVSCAGYAGSKVQ
ncbi:hypothetical protein LTR95_011982 [Oleoguttula sp. CCFEE 5521]